MKLEQITKRLKSQFEKTESVTIEDVHYWCVPMEMIRVSYKPIIQVTMDILMKIILISIQKAPFTSSTELSKVLLVEELFIDDLLKKMKKTGLIEIKKHHFTITETGKLQLQHGVYEEQLEENTVEMLYSSIHQQCFQGDAEELLDFEDFPEEIFKYYKEETTIDEDILLHQVMQLQSDNQEHSQQLIRSIDSVEKLQIHDVPCIEFTLYDSKKDLKFTRVWNTLLSDWDQLLEKLISNPLAV